MADETLSPDQEFLKKLDVMETSGMKRTKQWTAMWRQNIEYFFSHQLHHKKRHKDWDWVVINYIWPSAIQELAKLSRNYPRIITNPWDTKDTDAAETWQSALQWLWEKGMSDLGMRIEQLYAILDGKLFGYRVSKVFWKDRIEWDDEKKVWIGDVKYRLWHPAEFWASDEEKIYQGACGTERYVELEYAIRQWPQFEAQLRSEASKYRDKGGGGAEHIRGQLESSGTYPSAGLGGIDKGIGTEGTGQLLNLILRSDRVGGADVMDKEFVKINDTYFPDGESKTHEEKEEIPIEELEAAGQINIDNGVVYSTEDNKPIEGEWPERTAQKYEEPKYPRGRNVIHAGEWILNPDDQVYPYRRWPFVVTPHYLLPHMWQGMDCVQLFKSHQDMINDTVTHLFNNLKQFGDPKVAVEKGAIDTPPGRHKKHFRIGRGAGSIIRLVRGGLARFKILDPVPPSAAALALYTLFTQEFKNLSGLQSIGKGEKQPGKMTATEAHFLVVAGNDRIQLQSVFEDEWVKQVASLSAEICQDKYDLDRMMRIVGQERIQGAVQITGKLKTIRFDVDIEPGQTLPYDEDKRIEKARMAYEMMQQPISNPMLPEMLRILKIPGWQKLLEKYQAWQLYFQFYQLSEGVKAGEIESKDAIQMIMRKATELYAAGERESVKEKESAR